MLIALIAVLASILLIDLVEQMRTVGTRSEISLLEALRLTLLKTPMLVEQTLPFVVLAGAMMAIIGLNRVERIGGDARGRRFGLALPHAVGVRRHRARHHRRHRAQPAGRALYQQFETEKQDALSERIAGDGQSTASGSARAIDDGQVVIHADGVDASGTTLQGATFMFFEVQQDALRFTRRIRAETRRTAGPASGS